MCTKADPASDLRLGFCWFYDSMTIAIWHTKMTPRILLGQVGNEFNLPPGAGGMPGGADMGTCMKLEILSIPLSIFLYKPNFARKNPPDESFLMKGIDLPLA
jgi:hypothetical protein